MAKNYEQYCPVAHALELVGERWSLLIVRELLKGPKRYTDLADALPRIGTNILAARLKDLEACEVVAKRRLPPPTCTSARGRLGVRSRRCRRRRTSASCRSEPSCCPATR